MTAVRCRHCKLKREAGTAWSRRFRVHKVGGPEAMVYEDVELPAPGPGEVRVRNRAIGVNFIDVYYRTGLYPAPRSRSSPAARRPATSSRSARA